jgi:hypothetical protein
MSLFELSSSPSPVAGLAGGTGVPLDGCTASLAAAARGEDEEKEAATAAAGTATPLPASAWPLSLSVVLSVAVSMWTMTALRMARRDGCIVVVVWLSMGNGGGERCGVRNRLVCSGVVGVAARCDEKR